MKQFFLLTALSCLLAVATVQAQNCAGSKAASYTHAEAAAQAAAQAANIEKHTDQKTGKVAYVRKSVCENSGKATFTKVEYCSKSGKFVDLPARELSCTKPHASCSRSARAAKVSNNTHTDAQKADCAKTCSPAKASSQPSNKTASARLVKHKQ